MKLTIKSTPSNFCKVVYGNDDGFSNEKQVNEWFEEHVEELCYIQDFLLKSKEFDGDLEMLGDVIHLLNNLKFEEEK